MKFSWRQALGLGVLCTAVAGVGLTLAWARSGPQPERFRTVPLSTGPLTQVVLASGTLQPVVAVSVGTQVSGTVMERLADFNDQVRKGQVLLRLDPAALQARLRQSQAQLASAQASLTLAASTLERNSGLERQGFLSQLALQQNQRELDAAQANVDTARAQVDAAQTDLDNSVVRSPVDGVVIKRSIDVGQTVAASFQTPDLFQIAQDLRRMLILVSVAEQDVGQVQQGQEARFVVDAYPERDFQGKVTQVRLNASSNQGVVSYTVAVEVDNSEGLLKPGMTAQTRIIVATKAKALRIPVAALRFRPEDDEAGIPASLAPAPDDDGSLGGAQRGPRTYRVYTVGEKQKPRPHDVTTGISNQRWAEVLGGSLKEGDAVIVQLAPKPGENRER